MTTLSNDVQVQLADDVLAGDTSILVQAAVSPLNNPPEPPGGETAVLTLVDHLAEPTQIEIVTYTTVTDNQDGTWTIGGLTRGQEGTSAQAFNTGGWVFQSATRAVLMSLLKTRAADIVATNSPSDGKVPMYLGGELVWFDVLGDSLEVISCSPNTGDDTGATEVTLTVVGAKPGATVEFDSNAGTEVSVESSTKITCKTPPGTGGSVDIVVTNPDGATATLVDGFTYVGEVIVKLNDSGTWQVPTGVSSIDLVVVGGGGGAGYVNSSFNSAGGGGAGEVVFREALAVTPEANIAYSVGAGGAPGPNSTTPGESGGDSTFGDLTALGGGGGGSYSGSDAPDGGSGGGGYFSAPGDSIASDGVGHDGASGNTGSRQGGGGGGAGAPGTSPQGVGNTTGEGGDGIDLSATFGTDYGESGWFGGGGAGGQRPGDPVGQGGQGGGGDGSSGGAVADGEGEDGMPETGGGGGARVGAGGSGVILIRYVS